MKKILFGLIIISFLFVGSIQNNPYAQSSVKVDAEDFKLLIVKIEDLIGLLQSKLPALYRNPAKKERIKDRLKAIRKDIKKIKEKYKEE